MTEERTLNGSYKETCELVKSREEKSKKMHFQQGSCESEKRDHERYS